MMYIIYEKDYAFPNSICGLTDSLEKAEQVLEKIAQEALKDCLAVDPKDSGIYWDDWTEEERETFYIEDIKSAWVIVERKMNTYILDGEVIAI